MIIAGVITRDVEKVPPDATLQEAAQLMDSRNIGSPPIGNGRRLIVLDRENELVGILALEDVAVEPDAAPSATVAAAVAEISEPSRQT